MDAERLRITVIADTNVFGGSMTKFNNFVIASHGRRPCEAIHTVNEKTLNKDGLLRRSAPRNDGIKTSFRPTLVSHKD